MNILQTILPTSSPKLLVCNKLQKSISDRLLIMWIDKFFNNNFGMRIAPEDVKNTETLRSTLFANVMENLKKMDSQPSEAQQKMLQDAMGRITTDPNALPQVLDFWRGQLVSKVQEHNRRVKEAQEGPAKLRFPYSISVPMPEDQPPPGGGFKILGVR